DWELGTGNWELGTWQCSSASRSSGRDAGVEDGGRARAQVDPIEALRRLTPLEGPSGRRADGHLARTAKDQSLSRERPSGQRPKRQGNDLRGSVRGDLHG